MINIKNFVKLVKNVQKDKNLSFFYPSAPFRVVFESEGFLYALNPVKMLKVHKNFITGHDVKANAVYSVFENELLFSDVTEKADFKDGVKCDVVYRADCIFNVERQIGVHPHYKLPSVKNIDASMTLANIHRKWISTGGNLDFSYQDHVLQTALDVLSLEPGAILTLDSEKRLHCELEGEAIHYVGCPVLY